MEDIPCKRANNVDKIFKIVTIPNKMPSDILKGEKIINWL